MLHTPLIIPKSRHYQVLSKSKASTALMHDFRKSCGSTKVSCSRRYFNFALFALRSAHSLSILGWHWGQYFAALECGLKFFPHSEHCFSL